MQPLEQNQGSGDLEAPGPSQSQIVPQAGVAVSSFAENSFADALDPEEAPGWLAHYEGKAFSLKAFFPPSVWGPRYVRALAGKETDDDKSAVGLLPFSLQGDMIAGLTVGIMLVPQCLAFATLAGLPVQAGLYSSFIPLIVYSLFGTIRQVQVGPTALISLLSGQALDSMGFGVDDVAARMAAAAVLAVVAGLLSVLLGALRFGFIVDFMSHSVMTAFCTAAGITIGTSQMKSMLGITAPGRKKYWWKTIIFLVDHIAEAKITTVIFGFALLAMLLTLKYWKSAGSKDKRSKHRVWRYFPKDKNSKIFKVLKAIADLSSLVCVTIGWLWGYAYLQNGIDIDVVGNVETDGFIFAFPGGEYFNDIIGKSDLFVSAAVIAVVGFLETMAVGGKFAAQSRYNYEPNQELIALGLANVGSGLMSGYPGTGSFTRTAVNAQFGATSLLACGISSTLVLGAMYLLLPVIAKLPKAALAPIIIQGAVGVIDVHSFKVALKSSPGEFLVMAATFIVSLALSVKEGLLVGFTLSVLKTMNDLANPNLAICGRLPDGQFRDIRNFPHAEILPQAVILRMDARLSFANTRKLKEFALKAVQIREREGDEIKYVIVDGKSINHVDLTGCEMLEVLAETLNSRNQELILANLKGPVGRCLERAGVPDVIHKHSGHLCHDMSDAMKILSTLSKSDHVAEAKRNMSTLLERHASAQQEMAKNKQPFYKCSAKESTAPRSKTNGINENSTDSTLTPPEHKPQALSHEERAAI